ncbi:thioredoxin family protein [Citrobacter sedlakii]|uniref:cytochrome c biogenesis protein CcdA n=1 Tax=Citrobacter TaxID=544 RepID=UPI00196A0063|nr:MULTISPECIES: protein-disulfide reductase DsbD domain-containing protein [Citrobacter]MBM9566297.1 thioredoxin family protein [Citrobacter sedlakii]HBL4689106.1 thioredoxin family protein [Citrobacter sedlakii]HBL4703545.1 thioredoxin family protein [Citrobacter sedlakii]HBL4717643.1 thioredoxin family protein [Citrobacter sedlakii]HCA7838595.1 thioredoxin family protein [Citrobacter sedlakii]
MILAFRQALICLLFLWLPVSWAAESGWLRSPQNDHASVRVRADTTAQGETRLLIDVKLEDGWKTYWRSPGEGGIAPSIAWKENSPAVNWFWPTPARFDVAGITTQGYHQRVTFPLRVQGKAPATLAGVLTLSTCSNVCLLTDYPFSVTPSSRDAGFAHDYAQAMGRIPLAQGLTDTLQADARPGELIVTAQRSAGWTDPALFLDSVGEVDFGKPHIRVDGDTMRATVPVHDSWGEGAPDLRGQPLTLVLADNEVAQESELTPGDAPAAVGGGLPLWQVVLMALAGGLILNLMPCVLPVLAMKLGSVLLVEDKSRRQVRRQFLASVVGILASFMALALLMTILRLSNQALGWGIQFQNPWFIGVMMLVMLAFSASLFGLFTFRLPASLTTKLATQGGNGLAGHFWQGAFATLLATPCSAPFLGTAVAVALTASLPTLWGLFLALGVGMSLPWLLVAMRPGLAQRLPRPGRWMNGLRRLLGLMMLGSAIWLATLLLPHLGFSSTPAEEERVNWQPLSEQAITDALAQHKRVFIDVTAEWCITCKVNKYNVLTTPSVQEALGQPDVVALRGDWTLPSDEITAFLNARGQVAVPYNQIYGPGLPQGQTLPTLLTRDNLLKTLAEAKGETP